MLSSKYNIVEPIFSGKDRGGSDISELSEILIAFPIGGNDRPLLEFEILVEVPDHVKHFMFLEAQEKVLRYMIAESMCCFPE